MTPTDEEIAEVAGKLTKAEIEEGKRHARESGWPDALYFGLFGLARDYLRSNPA